VMHGPVATARSRAGFTALGMPVLDPGTAAP
jgi:hypothetical protein